MTTLDEILAALRTCSADDLHTIQNAIAVAKDALRERTAKANRQTLRIGQRVKINAPHSGRFHGRTGTVDKFLKTNIMVALEGGGPDKLRVPAGYLEAVAA